MRKASLLLTLILSCAVFTPAQLVKSTNTNAGTPEDKALDEISNTTDPAQKLALIEKFQADFGKGEFAVLALDLHVSYYSDAKDYAKMADYAEKIMVLDPDNFAAVVHLAHAYSELHNPKALVDTLEKLSGILTRYKAQTPPADAPSDWKSLHDQSLADNQPQIEYVQSLVANGIFADTVPAERAALADRYATVFPDASYAPMAESLAASSYQQAQDTPHMIAAAEKAVAMNPNSIDMLLLLADAYSSSGNNLDKASEYSKKALQLLPVAKKPDSVTDDQWKKQTTLQTGVAWSAQGQVQINKNDLNGAAASFQKASPLLKADTPTYARNLYRLGFTYARLQKIPEAKAALAEAASYNTPFKSLAQQTLEKLGTAPPPKRAGRGN